jgi:hypothetical protein
VDELKIVQEHEYNTLEGLVSIIAGLIGGSVSLVGFGLDFPLLMQLRLPASH